MNVAIVTTSYPRFDGDFAGRFIEEAVRELRTLEFGIEVVRPGTYDDFGLAYGRGVAHNVPRRPWALPPMLASMALATRRAARDADLVHAYWLPTGLVAATAGKPFVLTLLGTDVALARRVPWLARPILRAAREVICISTDLAIEARRMGARDPIVIPVGVEMPDRVVPATGEPTVLYAGRLSPEKGIEELMAATDGVPLTVAGDGPMRDRVPDALGMVPSDELSKLYDEAAVIVCPSRREGFGLACAEAMAHGRPVVASDVGGLRDLVVDGETGLFVPPRDPVALREAIDRLLRDEALRTRMGTAGRRRILEMCSWASVARRTASVYASALAVDAAGVIRNARG